MPVMLLLAAQTLSAQTVPVPLPAARTAPADTSLSLAEARASALAKSAAVRKYTLAVQEASLVKQAQQYQALPSLDAAGSAAYDVPGTSSSGITASADLSAGATVFDGGKNMMLSKKYDYALQGARADLRAGRITVIGSVDSAFYAVLEDKASLEAAESDLAAAKLRLDIAQVKAEAGTLSKFDLLETQSEIASYQAAADKARTALVSARAKLASLTGCPVTVQPAPVDFSTYGVLIQQLGTLDSGQLDAFASSLVSSARTNSPSYSAYILAAKEADRTLAAAKAAVLPKLSASLSGKLSAEAGELVTSAGVTLSASVDLDAWTLANTVKQAENLYDQAQTDTAGQGETLDLDVTQAVYSWISAAVAIPSCVTALDYAKTNYENVLEKFKLSSATNSDVSTAQALVRTDENALISARYSFLSSLSTLRGLVGIEDDSGIINAVP
jgi:Outer membrane protein